MDWVIVALLGLALLSRMALYIRLWAWKRSRKDPKERLEAEILWRNFRRK